MAGTEARRSRRAPALRLLVLLALMAGCGGSEVPPAAAPATVAGQGCGDVRPSLGCRSVVVAGVARRYAVQGPRGAREAVVVDLGGPGRALFGGDDLLHFASRWPGDEALVFVEEPWVTDEGGPRCDAARSAFYRSLRGRAGGAAASRLVEACGLREPGRWGWSAEAYATTVEAVLAAEGLELTGVVGTSYGAVRAEALWDAPSVRWLILNSPAPTSAGGAAYLAGRRQGALDALARACPQCDRRTVPRLARALDAAPVTLATRTPPVVGMDAAAALLGLTHLLPPERAALARKLRGPPADVADAVGALSDATLLRYGAYELSPAMLAYLDEVCRQYGPWPAAAGRDPLEALLVALHAPCRELAPSAPPPSAAAPPAVCIARGGEDDVTPAAFAAGWRARFPDADTVQLPDEVHGTAELAHACRLELRD